MSTNETQVNALTVTEAAHALGVSRTRIYQLLEAERLVRARTAGGALLVDATSVRLYKK